METAVITCFILLLYLPLIRSQSQFEMESPRFRSSSRTAWVNQLETEDHPLKFPRATPRISKMTDSDKLEVVRLHNLYRSMVIPPAADMEYMEWDDRLASLSQRWAEVCQWKHGNPQQSDFRNGVGQNLYRGTTPSVAVVVRAWYEEYKFYYYQNISCKPNKQCGHYSQMIWARTHLVGCGIKHRCWTNFTYYIVCNYWPSHHGGEKPYKRGRPCSLCNATGSGLCSNKSCVNKLQCEKYNLDCGCDLVCHNCGELDRESCTCKCKDGWKGADCSEPCVDTMEGCSFYHCIHYQDATYHRCEKYCKLCTPVNPDDLRNTCCDGEICPRGRVLDLSDRPCECKPLCPGPKCGSLHHGPYLILLVAAILLSEYNAV